MSVCEHGVQTNKVDTNRRLKLNQKTICVSGTTIPPDAISDDKMDFADYHSNKNSQKNNAVTLFPNFAKISKDVKKSKQSILNFDAMFEIY